MQRELEPGAGPGVEIAAGLLVEPVALCWPLHGNGAGVTDPVTHEVLRVVRETLFRLEGVAVELRGTVAGAELVVWFRKAGRVSLSGEGREWADVPAGELAVRFPPNASQAIPLTTAWWNVGIVPASAELGPFDTAFAPADNGRVWPAFTGPWFGPGSRVELVHTCDAAASTHNATVRLTGALVYRRAAERRRRRSRA